VPHLTHNFSWSRDLLVGKPVEHRQHLGQDLLVESGIRGSCFDEERKYSEALGKDRYVGEVARLCPTEQREQLAPGQLQRSQCRTKQGHGRRQVGR
jgi:hypothetical protein